MRPTAANSDIVCRLATAVATVVVLSLLVACAGSEPPTAIDDDGPRVVSLSPAISETLVEIGLGERVVGRTPWCVALDDRVPVVGDLMEVDAERLIAVAPTVILVQPPRSGLDEGLRALAARRGWALATWRIDGIGDILRVIDELPAAVLPPGAALERAQDESRRIRAAIESALTPDPAVGAAGRTLMLFGIDPPMAFGVGSYLGEVLERLGGTNAVTARGFPQLTLEDLVRSAPDAVVLVGGAARSERAVTVLAELGVPADPSRLLRLDEPAALVPGPSLARVAERLRAVLVESGAQPRAESSP